MSGHSKWANIQHRKGRQDAKRSNLWTKLVRERQQLPSASCSFKGPCRQCAQGHH